MSTSALSAASGTWTIDASHTNVGFSVRHAMVAKVRGSFTDVEGTITIDGDNPASSSTNVTIKTDSFDSKNEDRDAHIKSDDFLSVETFPTITFASTELVEKSSDEFVLRGDLTVKDVTKPVELEVEYVGVHGDPWGGTRVGFEASTEISREEFGLTWNVALEAGGVLVGDKVKITLDVEAVKNEG